VSVKLPVFATTVSDIEADAVVVPEVPVIVTVEVSTVAVALAVKVTTLAPVVGLVPKAVVTPLGRPVAAKVTLPVKPPVSVTVMLSVAVLPCVTETAVGDAASVKPALAVTVKGMVVDAVRVPDVPVIVTVDVPTVAVAPAANVTMLVPVVGLVPKVAVTPEGRPVAARATLPVKPFTSATEIVSVPLAPCAIDKEVGEELNVKLGVFAPQVTPLIANDVGIAFVTLFQVPLNPMPL
jgi:hypothetical protein